MLIAECNAAKNRLSNRSGFSPIQRVPGCAHRFPGNLTSDDPYEPDAIPGTGSGDAEMERAQKVREAAVQAHVIVSIRDR
eukprot:10469077-Lingulodinium_polyedra.AAC.1